MQFLPDAAALVSSALDLPLVANKMPTKILWYTSNMAAKAVQISLDPDLLSRIDSDPETRERGRSAFVRSAIEVYLRAKRRREIDRQIIQGYAGKSDEVQAEVEELMGAQVWLDD